MRDLLTATEALTRPTLSHVTSPLDIPDAATTTEAPDLMTLLSAYKRPVADRPLLEARPKAARPGIAELIRSDRASTPA